jgi:hypothetical protein
MAKEDISSFTEPPWVDSRQTVSTPNCRHTRHVFMFIYCVQHCGHYHTLHVQVKYRYSESVQ